MCQKALEGEELSLPWTKGSFSPWPKNSVWVDVPGNWVRRHTDPSTSPQGPDLSGVGLSLTYAPSHSHQEDNPAAIFPQSLKLGGSRIAHHCSRNTTCRLRDCHKNPCEVYHFVCFSFFNRWRPCCSISEQQTPQLSSSSVRPQSYLLLRFLNSQWQKSILLKPKASKTLGTFFLPAHKIKIKEENTHHLSF